MASTPWVIVVSLGLSGLGLASSKKILPPGRCETRFSEEFPVELEPLQTLPNRVFEILWMEPESILAQGLDPILQETSARGDLGFKAQRAILAADAVRRFVSIYRGTFEGVDPSSVRRGSAVRSYALAHLDLFIEFGVTDVIMLAELAPSDLNEPFEFDEETMTPFTWAILTNQLRVAALLVAGGVDFRSEILARPWLVDLIRNRVPGSSGTETSLLVQRLYQAQRSLPGTSVADATWLVDLLYKAQDRFFPDMYDIEITKPSILDL